MFNFMSDKCPPSLDVRAFITWELPADRQFPAQLDGVFQCFVFAVAYGAAGKILLFLATIAKKNHVHKTLKFSVVVLMRTRVENQLVAAGVRCTCELNGHDVLPNPQ
jgi:hypothetical protein